MKPFFCAKPFFFMEFLLDGWVACCCPAWVKELSGNLKNENSVLEIWNGPHFQKIRECLHRGDWESVCNGQCPDICRYLADGTTVDPMNLRGFLGTSLALEVEQKKIVLDSTPLVFGMSNAQVCNLKCIMCDLHLMPHHPELLESLHRQLQPLLPNAREIVLSGAGDPFVRPDTRAILFGPAHEHLKIRLLTNGQLFAKYWDRIQHHSFTSISISLDAATAETYEYIRRNGKWANILSALEVAGANKDRFQLAMINMAVMKENYKEIPAFIALAKRYGLKAQFARVRHMGDLPVSSAFCENDADVLKDFICVLNTIDPADIGRVVQLTNLFGFYKPEAAPPRSTIVPWVSKLPSD